MLKVRDQKGFTLIELLIVIAIIAILAAIAIPQFAEYRARGVESGMVSDVKNFSTALEGVFADCQDYTGTNVPLGPGPATMVVVGNAGRCLGAPVSSNVRISSGNTLSVPGARTATTYTVCAVNPGATRTGRAAVAADQRGVEAWGADCAAASAAAAAL